MTCSTHVYYCPFVIVTIADMLHRRLLILLIYYIADIVDMLFTIMSPVYLVTFPDICYIPCGHTLLMYMFTLHCIYAA